MYQIGIRGISFDIQMAWNCRHHRECLKKDMRLLQPWDINMTGTAALQKIASPKQRICMEVRNQEPLMKASYLI